VQAWQLRAWGYNIPYWYTVNRQEEKIEPENRNCNITRQHFSAVQTDIAAGGDGNFHLFFDSVRLLYAEVSPARLGLL
jgi:hypothetical protein